ncbi:hypothetical protein [Arthrobacter globiformis]|uniref:hypothetical protein n=1 Tax=Arthrobacter globiformis TaxID=1665 RepID=UPI0027D7CF49|nr:hypothetical protein [Arthrobacter globiformis]
MSAQTTTDANGRFNFRADSRTVYKVRLMDSYGWGGRNPFTFADKWIGGKSTFDDAEGYASAREIVLDAPGIIDLGTEAAAFSDLPAFTVSSKPTIIGDPAFGQELFATPGSWSPTPLYGWKYTWYRGEEQLTGARTDPTYRPGLPDVGQGQIHVVVSAAQWGVARYTEARSSDVSVPPIKLPDPGVTIEGQTQVGQRLTAALAVPEGWHAEYLQWIRSPQWYRDGIKISGAESIDYDIVEADLGAVLSFTAGDRISHAPVETPIVAPGALGAAPVPTITGDLKVGSVLTANPGAWEPSPVSLEYQWFRSGVAISGATESTYVLAGADAGQAFTVQVTGSRSGYEAVTKSSASTAAVAPGALGAAPVPTITGDLKVGSVLTANPGAWEPSPVSLEYQWFRSGVAISGATESTYVLAGADAGQAFTVQVTGSRSGYEAVTKSSASTAAVAPGALGAAPVPTITGDLKVGSVLTANPGAWEPSPVSLEYQWFRSGVAISGATESTYVLAGADAGQAFTVQVTGSRPGYTPLMNESASTGPIAEGSFGQVQVPRISGTPKYLETLSVPRYSYDWFSTPAAQSRTSQWYRDGVAIPGATSMDYSVQLADIGHAVSIRLTLTKPGYATHTVESLPTAKATPAVFVAPIPVVNGAVKVGNVLTFDTTTWNTGRASNFYDPQLTKRYQWYRSGVAVPGEIGPGYRLSATDLGKRVKLRVSISKPGYATVTKDSLETGTVAAGTLTAPAPTVTGIKKVGYALTATPGTWMSGTILKYQWYRSGAAIAGATVAKYTLGAADLGKSIKVRVTGSKAGYTTLAKDSAASIAVVAGTLVAPVPRISGTPRSGYTLTAAPGTWTYGTILKYQWYRSGVAIAGATGRTYRLVAADRYDTIKVRIVGTKAGYTTAIKYSASTVRIP